MYTRLLTAFLDIVENPSALPKFILVYCSVWLLWHNNMVLAFIISTGDLSTRYAQAVQAINVYQPFSVLFLTVFIYLLRFAFQYVISVSREQLDKHEQSLKSTFSVDNDVEQLLETLDLYREKLATSEENTQKAKQETKAAINKALIQQIQLEEALADNEILMAQTQKLEDKLSLLKNHL